MNKVSTYLEEQVLDALEAYSARTRKSKSMVVNDAVRVALMGGVSLDNPTALEQELGQLQKQLGQRDQVIYEAVRVLQEMLGLFIRTYLNDTSSLDAGLRAQAAAAGKQRFEKFLVVVHQSLQPGCSILDQLSQVDLKEEESSDD